MPQEKQMDGWIRDHETDALRLNHVEYILCLHLVNVTSPCVIIMINGHVTVYHYNDTRSTVTR